MRESESIKRLLIFLAGTFLFLMLILPLILVASEALAKGWNAYVRALTEPFAIKALILTSEATILAVVLNSIFGIASAWLLTKFDFRGKTFLGSLIDLPFAISPVVAGLFFIMLFGRMSPVYSMLQDFHVAIVFAVPGVILALADTFAVGQPLHIEILYNEYNFTAAFAVASILVILAILVLILRNIVEARSEDIKSR